MASLNDFKPVYFSIEERGPVVVVHLSKPALSEEDNIEQLAQELSLLVEQYGCRRLVADFQIVTLITSAALGKFIALHRNLHRRDGRLAICSVTGMVRDVLEATKLHEYFKLTNTVDEAVALLEAPASGQPSKSVG